jgi:hypothetical protein
MSLLLAFRPFLEPMALHDRWFLVLVPIALGVSMVYKAVRVRTMERYWYNVLVMTGWIVIGMLALALGLYLVADVYLRWMSER